MIKKAYLYDVRLYCPEGKYLKKYDEFIVVGTDDQKIDSEAKRVFDGYVENPEINISVLGTPMLVENNLISEHSKMQIDWEEIHKRYLKQEETRPREIGCVFSGQPVKNLTKDEILEYREAMEVLKEEHRYGDDSYLFIASKWKSETKQRFGEIVLFEACGIEFAGDIAEIYFLERTRTQWCCPIYVV